MPGVAAKPRKFFLLIALVALVASGCGRNKVLQGVNLKPISTDLVLGLPPVEKAPAPPNSAPDPNFDDLFKIPDFGPIPTLPPLPTGTPRPNFDCPKADPLTDFPEVAASTGVSGPPTAGTYRWLIEGTQDTGQLGGVVTFPKQIQKTVHDVVDNSSGEDRLYSYSVTEREVLFGSTAVVTQRYSVRQTASPADEDGVFLTEITTKVGAAETVFAPQPPIMIVQIPVTLGEVVVAGPANRRPIDEVGVDPTTQEVMRLQGTVLNRYTVDACGDVVQGWFVEGTREFVSANDANADGEPDAYTSNYNYMVATQYGGLVIYEWIESPCGAEEDTTAEERQADIRRVDKCSTAPSIVLQSNMGQLKPGPLPTPTPRP